MLQKSFQMNSVIFYPKMFSLFTQKYDVAQRFSKCVRVPLVVREISLVVRELPLVVRRGISELHINQAACPPKRFFFIV